jgi:hypothetical protein
MEHYNKISEELEQLGFKKENDLFIFDNVTYNTVLINGQQYKQPQHNYIHLQYIGEGYVMDIDCGESDSDESIEAFSEFDILNENKETTVTICAYDINDIKAFLNIQ